MGHQAHIERIAPPAPIQPEKSSTAVERGQTQLVEWLRTLYEHVGDWTTKPAPLFFESALKEYLADYDLDDEDSADEDDDEGDLANQ